MREIRTSGLMSGEGRRGWPKGPLPRPSSTLHASKVIVFVAMMGNKLLNYHYILPAEGRLRKCPAGWTKEMSMTDGFTPKPPGRVRGRPFEKGDRTTPPATSRVAKPSSLRS